MRLVISSICLFTIFFSGFTQNGILSGKVLDNIGEPMPFVVIIVDSTKNITQSDFEGSYSITLNKGKHFIMFSMTGFKTKRVEDVFIIPKEVTDLSVVMEETGNILEEVIVSVKAKDESVVAEAQQQKITAQ